nr:MAG TPA: hypothetical protein [Caudoviricetes sp.]
MIRLTVDDEAHAHSPARASKTALHVGVDVIYAPRWAMSVWLAPDGHLYYVNESDISRMPLTITPERFK